MHVGTGLSLKQTVTRARLQGLADVTDVALLKRLRSSELWLRELSRRLFDASRFVRTLVPLPSGRRVRAVDATTVEEPGATGTDWRVHYCIALPDLVCDFYEVTGSEGGETYTRLPVAPGDIILGDRGYCHREGVAYVLRAGGDAVVRLNSVSFPLVDPISNKPFALLPHLRSLEACAPGEWSVSFRADQRMWPARLCAVRKSVEAAERTKRKIERMARKKGQRLRPETLEFAEYIFVLATVDSATFDTAQVLELYRARWQIELCFKRMKSLLRLGHVPKRSDASARAWIQGKLLAVLLVERLIEHARLFSPWGYDLAATQPMAGVYRSA
jgi:hypothetical protein